MYKVIKYFADLQDNNHAYNVGDVYPRQGLKPDENRIKELAGNNNKQGAPLIELVEETPETETPAETKKAPKKSAKK